MSVTLGSPSKAFNIAGLQSAYAIADDLLIRQRAERGFNNDEIAEPNDFAIAGTMAAYDEGEPWLDAACAYLFGNADYARDAINQAGVGVRALDCDATYLLWLDCRALLMARGGVTVGERVGFLRTETGLILSSGDIYGAGGEGFIRMNLGTQRSRVEAASGSGSASGANQPTSRLSSSATRGFAQAHDELRRCHARPLAAVAAVRELDVDPSASGKEPDDHDHKVRLNNGQRAGNDVDQKRDHERDDKRDEQQREERTNDLHQTSRERLSLIVPRRRDAPPAPSRRTGQSVTRLPTCR